MRLIILEGPDGAGKTTLARELEQLGYRYVHHGVPPAEALDGDLFRWFLKPLYAAKVRADANQPTVFDRLHLSDRTYGPVMRGSATLTELQERLLERFLHARGGQVVLCLPPWRVVLNNWLKNQDNEYVDNPDKLFQVYKGYFNLTGQHRGYLTYDYTREDATTFARVLQTMHPRELPEPIVGTPGARFLFVGEGVNPNLTSVDLPFLDWTGSSGYLHAALDEAGYLEPELAFTNALAPDGTPNKLDHDQPWSVVALGNVAHAECVRQKVPTRALLAHPAHWKRFHAHERDKYVKSLADVRRAAL